MNYTEAQKLLKIVCQDTLNDARNQTNNPRTRFFDALIDHHTPFIAEHEETSTSDCEFDIHPGDINWSQPTQPLTANPNFVLILFAIIAIVLLFIELYIRRRGFSLSRQTKPFYRVFCSRFGLNGAEQRKNPLRIWWHVIIDPISFGKHLTNIRNVGEMAREEAWHYLEFLFHFGMLLFFMNVSRTFMPLQNGDHFQMPANETDIMINVIHLLLNFIVGIALFYRYADRNKIINGPSQEHTNQFKTLLVTKIPVKKCNETSVRRFLEQRGLFRHSVGVNIIRKVDHLTEIVNQLTVVEQTISKLKENDDHFDYYLKTKEKLDVAKREEIGSIGQQSSTAAFVTFSSRIEALTAYSALAGSWSHFLSHPFSWRVEWAPPFADIVWPSMHNKGNAFSLLLMTFNYTCRIFVTLFGSSMILYVVRMHYDADTYTGRYILPYLKSVLTMIFWCAACCLKPVKHSRNSSFHIGLFLSTLAVELVGEILLPVLHFNDLFDSFQWMAESPLNFNHWLRLRCFMRPDLGSGMASHMIQWAFLRNTFVLARLPPLLSSLKLWAWDARTDEEDRVAFNLAPPNHVQFSTGIRYAELVIQLAMTLIGSITYPDIIQISLVCVAVRYAVDGYSTRHTFKAAPTGVHLHRLAVLAVSVSFIPAVILLAIKNGFIGTARPESGLIWDVASVSVGTVTFMAVCLATLSVYFSFSPDQMYWESWPASVECRHYIAPILANHGFPLSSVADNTDSRMTIPVETDQSVRDAAAGFFLRVKWLAAALIVIFAAVMVPVAVRMNYFTPPVVYHPVAEVRIESDPLAPHSWLTLFAGRVPFSTMESECSPHNPTNSSTSAVGWLTIQTPCEDVLIDYAIVHHWNDVFGRIEPSKRFLWTAGYFNLSSEFAGGGQWRWMDNKTSTNYQNFCQKEDVIREMIRNATVNGEEILHIVKDYRNYSDLKGACWLVLDRKQLIKYELTYGPGHRPRMAFACKSSAGRRMPTTGIGSADDLEGLHIDAA